MKNLLRCVITLSSTMIVFSACSGGGQIMGGTWGVDSASQPDNVSLTSQEPAKAPETPAATAEQLETVQQILNDTKTDTVTSAFKKNICEAKLPTLPTEPPPTKTPPEEPILPKCTNYLPADADLKATVNTTEQDSILWAKMSETSAIDYMKLLDGVTELCFAAKYVQPAPITLPISGSTQTISKTSTSYEDPNTLFEKFQQAAAEQLKAIETKKQTLYDQIADLEKQAFLEKDPEVIANLDMQKQALYEQIAQLDAQATSYTTTITAQLPTTEEPSVTEQAISSIDSVAFVVMCKDSACTSLLQAACEAKNKLDMAEGKPGMACKVDTAKNIVFGGNLAWTETMMDKGELIVAEKDRFDELFAKTREATVKVAGNLSEQVKQDIRDQFTTINFTVPEETDVPFVFALTANPKKMFFNLKTFSEWSVLGLEDEPVFDAWLFIKPPENFSLEPFFNNIFNDEPKEEVAK